MFCSSLRYSIYKVQCFALLRTLTFYHIEGRLSRCFFIFFRVFSVICVPSSRFSTPFIRQLAYYNAPGINCQALFSLFSIYFFHPPRRSNVHNWRTIPERNTQIFEELMARQIGVCKDKLSLRASAPVSVAIPPMNGTR